MEFAQNWFLTPKLLHSADLKTGRLERAILEPPLESTIEPDSTWRKRDAAEDKIEPDSTWRKRATADSTIEPDSTWRKRCHDAAVAA